MVPSSQLPPLRPRLQPVIIRVLAVGGMGFLLLPIAALLSRLNAGALPTVFSSPATREMVVVTLGSAVLATIITVVFGVPIAVWLAAKPKAAKFIRFLVYLPLAMPPVVAGLALTATLGRRSIMSEILDAIGFQFAFSFAGVVVAHAFIALPFVIITVDAAYRSVDPDIFTAATALGVSTHRIFTQITLPLLGPAIITGAGLAFARSLGEFGTTITFAGSLPGQTRTLPVGIYMLREVDSQQAYALAAVLMTVAFASLGITILPELLKSPPRHSLVTLDEASIDTTLLQELSAPHGTAPTITVHSNRASVQITANHCTALVGPNGSGKSTLAELIAGRYSLGGDFAVLFDKPNNQRCIMLTQNPALPPHCTVLQAITMVTSDSETAMILLKAAGLARLARIPITQLSGGQAAQIALLRALATRPEVLILDEPLAAVDITSANRWRQLLGQTLAGRTVVLISHNPTEIAALANVVIPMTATTVHPPLPINEFFHHPPDRFSAEFIGMNRVECTITEVEADMVTARAGELTIIGRRGEQSANQSVALFSPNAVTVSVDKPQPSSAQNCWPAQIIEITHSGGIARLLLQNDEIIFSAVVTQRAIVKNKLMIGTTVYCTIKAVEIICY